MSVVVVATAIPKPEFLDEVRDAFTQAVARVHAEDAGCELYALNEADGVLVVVEKWASREHLGAHSSSPALAELGPKLEGRLAEPVKVQVLQPVPAGTPEQGTV